MRKIGLLICMLPGFLTVYAQQKNALLPVLKADSKKLTLVIDSMVYQDVWTIDKTIKPDILKIPVKRNNMTIQFRSGIDSLTYTLTGGQKVDFIVLSADNDTAYLQIDAQKFTNPATFTKKYIRANNLKTTVEIPAVYELVNIVIALTKSAANNRNLAYRNSDYYKKVMDHFGPYKTGQLVNEIDSMMKHDKYHHLKMDAYAYVFEKGKIQPSKVYDRVSWGAENTLRPFISGLQKFADESGFANFYKNNQPVYQGQIRCYQDSMNTAQMVTWLRKNYPTCDFNAFKIIFSPLVSGNQSANSFNNNGFKEAQAHVNFPYLTDYTKKDWSSEAINLERGSIVFTELNHSFNDRETEKHQRSNHFISAFSNLNHWIEKGKPASGYNNAASCFNEYMNWGLVSLYYADHAPKEEQEKMISSVENNMQKYRGFKKFPEFNRFLVQLYKNRGNKVLAELYPEIIDWFENNKEII